MVTKEECGTSSEFWHVSLTNADGTPVRCRANGALKTWKRDPDRFQLPVKYGFKSCFYLTPRNAHEWVTAAYGERCLRAGLSLNVPPAVLHDYETQINAKTPAIAGQVIREMRNRM
jgi:hypothetical protein